MSRTGYLGQDICFWVNVGLGRNSGPFPIRRFLQDMKFTAETLRLLCLDTVSGPQKHSSLNLAIFMNWRCYTQVGGKKNPWAHNILHWTKLLAANNILKLYLIFVKFSGSKFFETLIIFNCCQAGKREYTCKRGCEIRLGGTLCENILDQWPRCSKTEGWGPQRVRFLGARLGQWASRTLHLLTAGELHLWGGWVERGQKAGLAELPSQGVRAESAAPWLWGQSQLWSLCPVWAHS